MSYHELHCRLEDCVGKEREHLLDSPEVAVHVRECLACRNLANSRRELSAQLQLLREDVPPPSSAVDAAMLARYRGHIAQVPVSASTHVNWPRTLRSTAAMAAMVLIATAYFFLNSKPQRGAYAPSAPPPPAPHLVAAAHAPAPRLKAPIKSQYTAPRHTPRRLPATEVGALPGFESLMYCDPLSCSGDMEMIRVQLPATALAMAPVSTQANASVYADVLVGPDGIARGIRIVQ